MGKRRKEEREKGKKVERSRREEREEGNREERKKIKIPYFLNFIKDTMLSKFSYTKLI